jgi:prophage regulatory protein
MMEKAANMGKAANDGMEGVDRLVSIKVVAELLAIRPPTVWKWLRTGDFPKPVHLSARVVRWRLSDIVKYQENL